MNATMEYAAQKVETTTEKPREDDSDGGGFFGFFFGGNDDDDNADVALPKEDMRAYTVEQCQCPRGYMGTSCQVHKSLHEMNNCKFCLTCKA